MLLSSRPTLERLGSHVALATCIGVFACAKVTVKPALGAGDLPKINRNTIAQVQLGRDLFFDPVFSLTGKMSCATCHDPRNSFAESKAISEGIGINARRRNTSSVLGVGLKNTFGWDGRFNSLEAQAEDAFTVDGDMGISIDHAVKIAQSEKGYQRKFKKVFGGVATRPTFLGALAMYQRFLQAGGSRFDRYMLAGDSTAITQEELQGWELFSRLNCAGCHVAFTAVASSSGTPVVAFSDFRFHNLGVGYMGHVTLDSGRYLFDGELSSIGAFVTPSLRNVSRTAPYMHDGSLRSLEDVIKFYEAGGIQNPNLDPIIKPFTLTARERQSLVQFLRSLDNEIEADLMVRLITSPNEVHASSEQGRAGVPNHPWKMVR